VARDVRLSRARARLRDELDTNHPAARRRRQRSRLTASMNEILPPLGEADFTPGSTAD